MAVFTRPRPHSALEPLLKGLRTPNKPSSRHRDISPDVDMTNPSHLPTSAQGKMKHRPRTRPRLGSILGIPSAHRGWKGYPPDMMRPNDRASRRRHKSGERLGATAAQQGNIAGRMPGM
jgi:hypothetical protein